MRGMVWMMDAHRVALAVPDFGESFEKKSGGAPGQ